MAEVTDPNGVLWSVRRRRSWNMSGLMGTDDRRRATGDFWFVAGSAGGFGFLLMLVLLGCWPLWFIAHWLGLPWRIVIERDGEEVDEEAVRGWLKSRRRIQEITESATAGTL